MCKSIPEKFSQDSTHTWNDAFFFKHCFLNGILFTGFWSLAKSWILGSVQNFPQRTTINQPIPTFKRREVQRLSALSFILPPPTFFPKVVSLGCVFPGSHIPLQKPSLPLGRYRFHHPSWFTWTHACFTGIKFPPSDFALCAATSLTAVAVLSHNIPRRLGSRSFLRRSVVLGDPESWVTSAWAAFTAQNNLRTPICLPRLEQLAWLPRHETHRQMNLHFCWWEAILEMGPIIILWLVVSTACLGNNNWILSGMVIPITLSPRHLVDSSICLPQAQSLSPCDDSVNFCLDSLLSVSSALQWIPLLPHALVPKH